MDYSSVTQEIVEFIEAYAKYSCNEVIEIETSSQPSSEPGTPLESSEEEDNVSIRYDCSDSSGSLTSDASSLVHFDILDTDIISILAEPISDDASATAIDEGITKLHEEYTSEEIEQFLKHLNEVELDISVDDIMNTLQENSIAEFFKDCDSNN